MNIAAYFRDTLQNLVSGLGTSKDKATANNYVFNALTPQALSAAHRGDWIARKVIDIIPKDMTRAWRAWHADEEQVERLEETERKFMVLQKVFEAMQKARLFGGAGIYIGIRDSDPEQPLDPETVTQDQLEYLHVLTRYEMASVGKERDIASPNYGLPQAYQLAADTGRIVKIHYTRVIPFIGHKILYEGEAADGWGDSVLQSINDAVMNAGFTQQQVASLLQEIKLDVITIPGLSDHLSTDDGTQRLVTRFTRANQLKSHINALVIEGDGETGEQWQQKQLKLEGIPEILQQYLQVAAGAADIPVTRLLGQSPSGLNATGDADIRNYYDHISSEQEITLRPRLSTLDEVLIRSTLGSRDEDIHYRWNPLWQMTDKEKAEIGHKKAETTKIFVDTGIVPPDVMQNMVKNQIIEDGTYPNAEAAYDESDNELDGDLNYGEGPPLTPEEIASGESAGGADIIPLRRGAAGTSPRQRTAVADATPRTLYVRRQVKNAAAILRWAKSQGFRSTLKASDLHVTIAYSTELVDWMKVNESWADEIKIREGGPRVVERFGEATVLQFNSSELKWRHQEIRDAGASWDHPEYLPHITISYDAADLLLDQIKPYQGEIVLGPEIFEEVDSDWQKKVEEK